MTRIFQVVALGLLVSSGSALAAPPARHAPDTPAEISSAAPAGSSLLAYESSGTQPDADAVAVFETPADKDGTQYRTLTIFQRKDGKFVPILSSDKIIGCSRCTQFHDDPFWPDNVKVTPGRIEINQGDGGETSSETGILLIRRSGDWKVDRAVRSFVDGGRGPAKVSNLPLPASGLAKDFDAKWSVPFYLNTLMVNNRTGAFMLTHRGTSPDQVWETLKDDCNKQDCTILVQQQDGCISLVKDGKGRFFGAGIPNSRDKKAAISKATDACTAAGGRQCEAIRTDCTRGI
jgi:hypothetical protein